MKSAKVAATLKDCPIPNWFMKPSTYRYLILSSNIGYLR
jgi:hypothetical protein